MQTPKTILLIFSIHFKIMPKVSKVVTALIVLHGLLQAAFLEAQNMLGYVDYHGNFYVYDTDRIVKLEHQQVENIQYGANSLAYLNSSGELKYYAAHKVQELGISNPKFFLNTDKYLYYSSGYNFSLFNGEKRQQLGYIQNHPYSFSDSIAIMHDYSAYLYAYWENTFIPLETQPAVFCAAGDNIAAYIDAQNRLKSFWQGETYLLEDYQPLVLQCGANTVTYIDNYKYLKVFWQGRQFELTNYSEVFCKTDAQVYEILDDTYCHGIAVQSLSDNTPIIKTGDNLVAYMSYDGAFHIFYNGNFQAYASSMPKAFDIADNILWWVDDNNFFHVFYNGEDQIIESYKPTKIIADKDVVIYTDTDNKLKAFYAGKSIRITDTIVREFSVNNTLVMYSTLPNSFAFYVLQ
jgi:hypothetical protein